MSYDISFKVKAEGTNCYVPESRLGTGGQMRPIDADALIESMSEGWDWWAEDKINDAPTLDVEPECCWMRRKECGSGNQRSRHIM